MTIARNELTAWPGHDGGLGIGTRWATALVLGGWFLLALGAGWLGAFATGPTRPPLAVLAAVLGPPLLFAAAYRASPRVRGLALGLDLRLLTALQGWRIVGVMFLVLYAHGLLPGMFAYPAGLGDLAVGLAAPFVLLSMIRRSDGWRRRAVALNVAGLLDFVGAIGTGVLASGSPLGALAGDVTTGIMAVPPLSLIPTFAVPCWIILHMISLLQLARLRHG